MDFPSSGNNTRVDLSFHFDDFGTIILSMANLDSVKRDFETLLQNLQSSNRLEFLVWIKDKLNSGDWGDVTNVKHNEDIMMESIQNELRAELPLNAVSSTETIHFPQTGMNADCDPHTTVNVDGFLYHEDAIDDLCDEGKMSRNYCTQCGSHSVKPLTFITHSATLTQVKYIFRHLLPDLRGRRVLDVGSRTGAMLYGAYLYSGAGHIAGVEIDPTFCNLQSAIVTKYNMTDKIQVIHDDIQNQGGLVASSDVVILNNVFEFFVPRDVQIRLWTFLLSTLSKDTLLVTVPSLEESLQHLQTGIDWSRCVEPVNTDGALEQGRCQLLGGGDADDSDLISIHMYRVVANHCLQPSH